MRISDAVWVLSELSRHCPWIEMNRKKSKMNWEDGDPAQWSANRFKDQLISPSDKSSRLVELIIECFSWIAISNAPPRPHHLVDDRIDRLDILFWMNSRHTTSSSLLNLPLSIYSRLFVNRLLIRRFIILFNQSSNHGSSSSFVIVVLPLFGADKKNFFHPTLRQSMCLDRVQVIAFCSIFVFISFFQSFHWSIPSPIVKLAIDDNQRFVASILLSITWLDHRFCQRFVLQFKVWIAERNRLPIWRA